MKKKLFIPGPVEVSPEVLESLKFPMISHRSKDYEELHKRVKDKLRQFLGVKSGRILLFTSSGTGAMESSIRNLVQEKLLSTTCGAFGERWYEIALENGKDAKQLAVEWGRAVHPEMIEAGLQKDNYEAVTVVHSETSTGVFNPIGEISKMMRRFPDCLLIVDAVSSMGGVDIQPEKLGIDFIFAGVQKGFGLPPGLTVVWVADRAIDKAKKVKNRGHYFDLLQFIEFDEKNQTPETPVISLVAALDFQLERIFKEGIEKRFARHHEMSMTCRSWAQERFRMFPERGYEAITLSCIENTKNIDTARLNQELSRRGYVISDGYGKLKGKTFRIAHMGDTTIGDLKELLDNIDDILDKQI